MNSDLFEQAVQRHQAGDLPEAERLYCEVLRLSPGHVQAMSNLGQIYGRRGNMAEALRCYEAAIGIDQRNWPAHYNRAQVLRSIGRQEEAIEAYAQALTIEPRLEMASLGMGTSLLALGQDERAVQVLESARQQPTLNPMIRAALLTNLGTLQRQRQNPDAAISCFREALGLQPGLALTLNNLADALAVTGQIEEALECVQRGLQSEPADQRLNDNLLFWSQFHPAWDADRQRAALMAWGERFSGTATVEIGEPGRDRSPDRQLRVGFVSPDFRDHVVGHNLLPLFRNLDRKQFVLCCYSEVKKGDAMTDEFRHLADHFRDTCGVSDADVAQRIRHDEIDILVDLALHMADNRLAVFARKPAPVQVTFAGYPGSTGLKAINYRLTDALLDPPEHDTRYVEKSVRLPGPFWCYSPVDGVPDAGPLPALSRGCVTFGCLNSFSKVNRTVLALWARVLTRVPGSRLMMLAHEGEHRNRTLDHLETLGVARNCVGFCSPQPRLKYLRQYDHTDIGLDTVPYNGHSTSLDSFYMGVPVVTLVDGTVVGRGGLSQATSLGLPELVTRTEAEFVQIAATLAADLDRLGNLRAGLRGRMLQSPLMDATGFTRGIEAAFRDMWRAWAAAGHP